VPKQRVKRKRSKALVLMILPTLIFIALIGWLVCTVGPSNTKPLKAYQTPKAKNHDGVTFEPVPYEEYSQTIHN
jgi:cytochrome b561